MAMSLTHQDLHQIYNVTSILHFNDVKTFMKLQLLLRRQSATEPVC